jgi:hypothetical protein
MMTRLFVRNRKCAEVLPQCDVHLQFPAESCTRNALICHLHWARARLASKSGRMRRSRFGMLSPWGINTILGSR